MIGLPCGKCFIHHTSSHMMIHEGMAVGNETSANNSQTHECRLHVSRDAHKQLRVHAHKTRNE